MLTRLGCDVIDMGVVRDDPAAAGTGIRGGRGHRRRRDHQRRRVGGRGRFRERTAQQAGRSRVLENRHETRPAARLRQDRQRALLRPARQPGVGDGDVLPVRARCAAQAVRARSGAGAAGLQSALHLQPQESAGPHRVPARRAHPGRIRQLERARHRRAGLGHPALDVGGQLLHHPARSDRATSPPGTLVEVQVMEGVV